MAKKIPMRQCLGCREMKEKPKLIRVVRSPAGEVSLDARGKAPGRGAYVCPAPDCLQKALRTRAIDRALGTKLDDTLIERLEAELEGGSDGY
jgi:predicted RNA-binding protein YlxR (DUF448 family)